MRNRISVIALGAVAIAAFTTTIAGAQVKPRTDTSALRIKVDKGEPEVVTRTDTLLIRRADTTLVTRGKLDTVGVTRPVSRRVGAVPPVRLGAVPPKVDTVIVVRVDTVIRVRVDTVTNTVTNTVRRVDTVSVQTPPPVTRLRLPSGFYLGLGGGGTYPAGSLYNPNNTGPAVQLQLGWQDVDNLYGLRVDGNYSRPAQDAGYVHIGNDVHSDFAIMNADLKLRLPAVTRTFGISPQFNLYAIGGATWAAYQNARIEVNKTIAGFGPANAVFAPDWQDSWGWNVGGGASLLVRSVEIFAESRVVAFTPNQAHQARLIPVVLGVNWYGSQKQQ